MTSRVSESASRKQADAAYFRADRSPSSPPVPSQPATWVQGHGKKRGVWGRGMCGADKAIGPPRVSVPGLIGGSGRHDTRG
eukprot:2964669-Rhodomonas_salina.3